MADAPQKPEVQTTLLGKVDAFMRSVANTATFGYADKFAAWADSKVAGGSYQDRLEQQKKITEFDNQNNSGVVTAGQVAGVVGGGLAARSVLGAGRAFVAAYTGAAAATAVTATAAVAAEGATVAAGTGRTLLGSARSKVAQAASAAREAVLHPVQTVKAAGSLGWKGTKFIAKQATVIGAALGIDEGAKLASESVIGKAEAATGKDALETDKHKLADAGVSGAVAAGLAVATRGRAGVAATMVKGVALMAGVTAAVDATTEITASTAASLEEGEHAAAARSAGVGITAAAMAAVAMKRGHVDLKSIWNGVTANPLVALATGAQVAGVVVDAAERTDAKLAAAATPTVVASAETPRETAPVPESSVPASEEAKPAAAKHHAPRPHKAPPRRPREPKQTELAHAAEGTLVGITPEARVGLQVPDFSAQLFQPQDAGVPSAEKVAAAPAADEGSKIDTSRLGELLQTDSVPNQALQQVAEPRPERQIVVARFDNFG